MKIQPHPLRLASFLFIILILWSPSAFAKNIGIYFGTFDPPHQGHLKLVQKAVNTLHLDSVYMLPNYKPSKKPGASSFSDRHKMVYLETLRKPYLKLLPKSTFAKAFEHNPKDYIATLIESVRVKEGPQYRYFHLVGTDSFNKMVNYKKLPSLDENRIVAVFQRKGYAIRLVPEVKEALAQKKVQLFPVNIKAMSSSQLRRAFQKGLLDETKEALSPYIQAHIKRRGLYGFKATTPLTLANLPLPKGYRSQRPKLPKPRYNYKKVPLASMVQLKSLDHILTLDSDAYLKSKWPPELLNLITESRIPVHVIEGLWPDTMAFLRTQKHNIPKVLIPKRQRVGLAYILTEKKGKEALFISNVFGKDRVHHLLTQVSRLMHGHGRDLNQLNFWAQTSKTKLTQEEVLCQSALKQLKINPQHTVFIGYHGALNFMLSDLEQYVQAQGHPAQSLKNLDQWIAKTGRRLAHPSPYGNIYFPYWNYTHGPSQQQIISFRNTYGAATHTLIQTLLKKGAKHFVIFGNGGGLSSRAKLNHIYAPTQVSFKGTTFSFENQARHTYPSASLTKVASILDESQHWLKSVQYFDLVDVENFDAFKALQGSPAATLYSGILVSDRPGDHDITHKNEDAQTLIRLKREFFFGALQKALKISP